MPASKQGLVRALEACAALMELKGENPFRVRAYESGARALDALEGEPQEWLASGVLEHTKGIGKGMAEKVEEWVRTGHLAHLEELRAALPAGLIELATIPSLGPKKIKAVWEQLGVCSIEALEGAARDGRLAALPGFGAKTAEKILAGIEQRRKYSARHLLDEATEAAEAVVARLRELPQVQRLEVGGSLRRSRETIKDVDILITSDDPAPVMRVFVETPGVEQVVAHGPTKSSILLAGGIPVDLRVVEPEQFPAALVYFTGNKEHNTVLRGRAKRMGYKLNEYGLFPEGGEEDGDDPPSVPLKDEADVYRKLKLAYIPPEMREDMGEVEAAERGELPALITNQDIQGILHCHTVYSDGVLSVRELAEACQALGYQYLAICDHSQSAAYAGGLKVDDLRRQADEIDAVSERMKGFTIFKGIESDILADGALDYPDDILRRLDLVVASIHSRMSMDRETMTRRICRALEHPATAILGHPTGRLLLRREPFEVDLEQVFEVAARHGVVMEINAHPARLDLDWRFIRKARAAGCHFAINPDAHSEPDLAVMRYGVGIARKGWLEAGDVVNTMPAKAFAAWLEKRKKAW